MWLDCGTIAAGLCVDARDYLKVPEKLPRSWMLDGNGSRASGGVLSCARRTILHSTALSQGGLLVLPLNRARRARGTSYANAFSFLGGEHNES